MEQMYSICFGCEHCHINNGDNLLVGCRAFPEGVPENIGWKHSHDEIVEGQIGDYVYKRAKKDFDRFSNKIKFYQ